MLKIKDNVDLKELEKFGYKKGEDIMYCSYNAYGKIYEQQLDSVLFSASYSLVMGDFCFSNRYSFRKWRICQ